MGVLIFVIGALCVNFVVGESTYRAAIVSPSEKYRGYSSLVQEAGHLKADILVLPPPKMPADGSFAELEDYDEVTKSISTAAKQAGMYVVAHVLEKANCQNREELIRSNLVFDRRGSIVAVYRKSLNKLSNCTTSTQTPTFTTDFGVTFKLLMEEDLVLRRPGELKMKNAVVAGGLKSDVPFLNGPQFASSFAFVTNANLLTSSGVFAGKAGLKTGDGRVEVVAINKNGGEAHANYRSTFSSVSNVPIEDLSQYIIRPVDLKATLRGYSETVCNGRFCCDFYVKSSHIGSSQHEVTYGLSVFNGVRHFAGSHHIGAQSCAVVACAGLYKRTCALGPNNSTNTHFEKITISANFTQPNSAQFPLVVTTSDTENIFFKTETPRKVTISIENGNNLLNFGIFGRDFTKDFESQAYKASTEDESYNYYDYFFNDDVKECVDYIWIRLRILIFIVSIYVLEMM